MYNNVSHNAVTPMECLLYKCYHLLCEMTNTTQSNGQAGNSMAAPSHFVPPFHYILRDRQTIVT